MSQLSMFPKIEIAHGREWIWANDSAGWGMYFSRPARSKQHFFNPSAGQPKHPRSQHGPGECVDEFGRAVKKERFLDEFIEPGAGFREVGRQ